MKNDRPLLCALLALGMAACGGGKPKPGNVGPADTCEPLRDEMGRVVSWACGPTSDDLFDNGKIAEVHLTFAQADLDDAVTKIKQMGKEPCKKGQTQKCIPVETWLDILWARWQHCGPYENHVRVTMEYKSPDGVGNAVLRDAGIRLRGTKSRYSNPVTGFKLDFQALLPDPPDGERSRRFGGENKLSILSLENDSTLTLQCLAYKIMREYGDVPAPRCNHLKFFVNGVYYGLLQSVEEVDDSRFRRHFYKDSQDNGTLYSCSGGCGYDDSKADLEFYGDEFKEFRTTGEMPAGYYPKAYEPIHLQGGGPDFDGGVPDPDALAAANKAEIEANLIPMISCGDADSTPDDEAFKTCIQEWIDVDEWLKVVAAESLMPTVESFVGAKRNFYLYFKPEPAAPHGGRFLVYSWDYDAAMTHAGCNPSSCDPFTSVATWYTGGARPALVLRLTRVFKDRYCAAMNAFLHDTFKPELVDDFSSRIDPVMAGRDIPFVDVRDSVTQELTPRPPLTHDTWLAAIADLRRYIVNQRVRAQDQIDSKCAELTGDGGAPPDAGSTATDAAADAPTTTTDGGTP